MNRVSRVPISFLLPDWLRLPQIPMLLANELRAVTPASLSALLVLLVSPIAPDALREPLTYVAYALGCAGIGGLAFGHDFAHRTLVLSLAQPVTRSGLWWTRLQAIVLATLPLAFLGGWLLVVGPSLPHASNFAGIWLDLAFRAVIFVTPPLLAGTCLAPFFSLLCRGALAGTVFAVALAFGLFAVTAQISPRVALAFNVENQAPLQIALFSLLFVTACFTGFIGAWRQFSSLEAADPARLGSQLSFDLFRRTERAATRTAARRTSLWVQLAWKELRLQPLALVPAIGMLATAYAIRTSPPGTYPPETLPLATICWAIATCVVIGAIGSAEERQLGVLSTQTLLPVRRSAQWLVKLAVLLLLAQLLAVNLPLLALYGADTSRFEPPSAKWWSMGAIGMVSISLYLSSVSRTTMRAVLLALPCAVPSLLVLLLANQYEELFRREDVAVFWPFALPYLWLALIAGMLLAFAARNHFSAQPGERAAREALWICFLVFTAVVFCFAVSLFAGHF